MSVTMPDPTARLLDLPPPQLGPLTPVEPPVTKQATTDRMTPDATFTPSRRELVERLLTEAFHAGRQ